MRVRERIDMMPGLAFAAGAAVPRLNTPPASPTDTAPPGFPRAIRSYPFDRNFFLKRRPGWLTS
ncbi:MAG: hypothetical protein ABL956_09315 [Hyphomonadaceae bacterium]